MDSRDLIEKFLVRYRGHMVGAFIVLAFLGFLATPSTTLIASILTIFAILLIVAHWSDQRVWAYVFLVIAILLVLLFVLPGTQVTLKIPNITIPDLGF